MSGNVEWSRLFADAGIAWAADSFSQDDWRPLIEEIQATEAELRPLGARWFSGDLAREMEEDPEGLRPILQSFASPMTSRMRALAYLLVRGARLLSLRFEYQFREQAMLEARVDLGGDSPEVFRSEELWDAEVLRHLGLLKISGAPVMEGYYAFQQ